MDQAVLRSAVAAVVMRNRDVQPSTDVCKCCFWSTVADGYEGFTASRFLG